MEIEIHSYSKEYRHKDNEQFYFNLFKPIVQYYSEKTGIYGLNEIIKPYGMRSCQKIYTNEVLENLWSFDTKPEPFYCIFMDFYYSAPGIDSPIWQIEISVYIKTKDCKIEFTLKGSNWDNEKLILTVKNGDERIICKTLNELYPT